MVIPGDRVGLLLRDLGSFESEREHPLRELAVVVDSTFFSRYFLLISAYIEKFLQHAFLSEKDLDDHFAKHISRTPRFGSQGIPFPKRVIFWTTPYKQLYKDPAILVEAQGIIATVEQLHRRKSVSEALRLRILAGLRDAEARNESLWKLYVFLSDGLFYTGVLAKALTNHPCASNPKEHGPHLETAQRIVVRAIRAAWQYWRSKRANINLEIESDEVQTRDLFDLFIFDKKAFDLGGSDIPSLVSAVSVAQYLHSDDLSNCRDVRYKFDAKADVDAVLSQAVCNKDNRELIQQAVRGLGLELRVEELSELVARLDGVPNLGDLVQAVASRNAPVVDEKLRALWLRELE
jgi:hypothetical protein